MAVLVQGLFAVLALHHLRLLDEAEALFQGGMAAGASHSLRYIAEKAKALCKWASTVDSLSVKDNADVESVVPSEDTAGLAQRRVHSNPPVSRYDISGGLRSRLGFMLRFMPATESSSLSDLKALQVAAVASHARCGFESTGKLKLLEPCTVRACAACMPFDTMFGQ